MLTAGAVAVVVGLIAGFVAHELIVTERTIDNGTLSVTVPEAWTKAVDTERWTPPEADNDESSISAGTGAGWMKNENPGYGVFLGLLPGEALPTIVPQHSECGPPRPTENNRRDGEAYKTVQFDDCEHGGVTVERIIQKTTDRLLWVQVRAPDRATANEVLDSIKTSGM